MSDKMEELADSVFVSFSGYVSRAIAPILARIYELEKRTPVAGKDGKDGRDGIDGKDGASGINGKDGTDGRDGLAGSDGRDGIDGKAGEPGKDGKDGQDGSDGKDAMPARDGRDGVDGRDGKDGADGRDALDIDVLKEPDLSRPYHRGTFASYRSGLIRAKRNTDPVDGSLERAGWEVIVNGIVGVQIEQADGRHFALKAQLTDDTTAEVHFTVPTMLYLGVWKAGKYEHGDSVTRDGSLWHCERDTEAIPGASVDWVLCAKRGQNGKDGKDGIRGERGLTGEHGRDLTQMAFDGTKY